MESIQDLFKEWCISPDLTNAFKYFTENGITIEFLPNLSPENYKELFPHLGTRIQLQEKVTDLINAHALTESVKTKDSEELNFRVSISQLFSNK